MDCIGHNLNFQSLKFLCWLVPFTTKKKQNQYYHTLYHAKLCRFFIQTSKQKSQVIHRKHKLCPLTSQTSTQGAVFLLAASSSLSSSESFSSSHLIRCSISRLNFFTAFGPPSTTTIFTSLYRTAQPVNKTITVGGK